jgi:hypothetical protein
MSELLGFPQNNSTTEVIVQSRRMKNRHWFNDEPNIGSGKEWTQILPHTPVLQLRSLRSFPHSHQSPLYLSIALSLSICSRCVIVDIERYFRIENSQKIHLLRFVLKVKHVELKLYNNIT